MAVGHQELYKHGSHPPALFLCPAIYNSPTSTRWGCVLGTPIYNSSTSTRWGCFGPPSTILPPLRGGVFRTSIYNSSTSTRWGCVFRTSIDNSSTSTRWGCVLGTPIYNSSTSTRCGGVFRTSIDNSSTSTRWALLATFVMMSADHMCGDGCRPSSIVEQDVNGCGWL